MPPGFALAALGEGDAAGEGVAAGLTVFAGVVVAGTAGEADVAGAVVAGVLELVSSVAQPAAKAIETVATRSRAARLMKLMFANFIGLSSVRARLKSRIIIALTAIPSNGCSHSSSREISALAEPKASFSKTCLHD